MKIVVTANGNTLDAPLSPIFGRCPTYIFVETDTLEYEAITNPAVSAAGGAGIQAAQFVAQRDVEAVLTGNVGPNAFGVLQTAGVQVYLAPPGTVRDAVQEFNQGNLQPVGGASVSGHTGMRGGGGRPAQGSRMPGAEARGPRPGPRN